MEGFEYLLIHVGTNDVDNYVNHEPKRKTKPFEIDRVFEYDFWLRKSDWNH